MEIYNKKLKKLTIEEKKIRDIKITKFYEYIFYDWGDDDDMNKNKGQENNEEIKKEEKESNKGSKEW